ncbi:MAG: hypothetical protein L0H41_07355 [Microlunatus sp.]|nr:hypothetical protein [Microlunatus sp.]MDN5770545.1 hypothetical protein [Microlunatus sp.]MDN5805440.1 hypothetical protein [Microlunatus sp.]
MTRLTTILGAALVAIGVVAFVVAAGSSVTALIPAFVGGLILICAAVASRPTSHRFGIHAALVVALLGALGSVMNVAKIGQLVAGTAERPAAIITSVILFVLCVAYLVVGIRSFVVTRKARAAA